MERSRQRLAVITLLALTTLLPASGIAGAKTEAKRTEAIDKLAFAVEEIEIVERADDEGALDGARKQYKRAGKYFLGAMKGIRKANPSDSDREQTEVFEDRFHRLDPEGEKLEAETVHEIAELFREAHAYFDPQAGS